MEESTAMFDKEKAQERLSKLSGGVAVFKVYYLFTLANASSDVCCFALRCNFSFSHRLEGLVRPKSGKGKIGSQML